MIHTATFRNRSLASGLSYYLRKMRFCLVSALWLITVVPLSAQTTTVYTSPDRAMQAVVITSATGETQVEFHALPERVLLMRDDRSKDGQHGSGIIHASWTADSHFFVASTAASGGHQPWARPIWVYSRDGNRIIELWKLGVVATSDFTLKPPDIVVTAIKCTAENPPLTFSLHSLASTGRLPTAPCPNR